MDTHIVLNVYETDLNAKLKYSNHRNDLKSEWEYDPTDEGFLNFTFCDKEMVLKFDDLSLDEKNIILYRSRNNVSLEEIRNANFISYKGHLSSSVMEHIFKENKNEHKEF